jgi:hypothetical protein
MHKFDYVNQTFQNYYKSSEIIRHQECQKHFQEYLRRAAYAFENGKTSFIVKVSNECASDLLLKQEGIVPIMCELRYDCEGDGDCTTDDLIKVKFCTVEYRQ